MVISLVMTILVGGIAVGACLAALIPGTVELASAHRYTVDRIGRLSALAEPTTIYWNDGTTSLGTLGLQARQPITTLDEVPTRIVHAVIATEDRTFWTNDGIDLGAVARAFLINVTSGRIEQGGSTITQQLVKNRILTAKRDVNRKIKEIEDALRLNNKFSKRKILVEYLNTIYLGAGSYGMKAAASRYFLTKEPGALYPRGKRMNELTVGEAALLAGLIANPEGDNPFTYPDRAIRRRAEVLRGEVAQHYITQAEADAANKEPLPTVPPPAEQRPGNYLVAEVQDQLLNDPRLGRSARERRDEVLKGGLKVYTTFDQTLQTLATDATNNAKPASPSGPDWISSLVSIDPTTGAVKAMVGGPDFATSQYNIATHPVGRQPGSTWKTITLAGALQNGYSPNDQVDGDSPCSVPSKFGDVTTVNAEEGGGTETVLSATAGSVNCAFVRLSTSVGQDVLIDLAHKMGITQTRPTHADKFLTLSIGTVEATPLEMATVMATIADNGMHHAPYFVQKVVAPDGKVLIDEANHPGDQVLDPAVAGCEQNILRHVVAGPENHTGANADIFGQTIYGKTGTTDNHSDAWFVGANPPGATRQLATAVWFGNRAGQIPGAGFGGDSAAPIFRAFMGPALAHQADAGLPDPGPVCNRPGGYVNPDGGRDTPPAPTPGADNGPAQLPPTEVPPRAPVQPQQPPQPAPSPGNGNGNGNRNDKKNG